GTVFGVGLGMTAYTYGMRHAFDADHIAAIDNTTRKLRADGVRPKSVGFWFAMGHSATVFVLAVLVATGVRAAGSLIDGGSATHRTLGLISTLAAGGFLYLIAFLNLAALVGLGRMFGALRRGEYDEGALESHLHNRGLVARVVNRASRAIVRPWQMFVVGLLFGLGFDTATEIALLVLAGTGVAAGVPWYVVLVLPLLFAAGMSLLDCIDGLFMSVAYDWAFLNPARKVYYNLCVTGLSVAIALVIGTIELSGVLHDDLGWTNPVTDVLSSVKLGSIGFVIVGLFVLVWAVAIGYWKVAKIEERFAAPSE
ncbi:MAG TPA: HoxN/HupN/NixA family nickel/cobalt transporter, partial [Marmoricola sp.]|nr:HoxN/HupN/NixA family nickel/cobalt transporter [Marmoricola sp.]